MQHLKTFDVFNVLPCVLCACLLKPARGQDVNSVNQITQEYQTCLDAGLRMQKCSERYYSRMDSLLSVVIKTKFKGLTAGSADHFRTDQAHWDARKAAFFRKEDERFVALQKKGIWGSDNIMEIYGEKGDFIKRRLLVLLSHK